VYLSHSIFGGTIVPILFVVLRKKWQPDLKRYNYYTYISFILHEIIYSCSGYLLISGVIIDMIIALNYYTVAEQTTVIFCVFRHMYVTIYVVQLPNFYIIYPYALSRLWLNYYDSSPNGQRDVWGVSIPMAILHVLSIF